MRLRWRTIDETASGTWDVRPYTAAAPLAHAQAQPAPAAEPLVPVFAPDPSLLADFRGVEGVRTLSSRFFHNIRAHPRLGHSFEQTKPPDPKTHPADQ